VTDYVGRHTILAVVVGSRAYGLDGPGSDHDRRGVYAAPTPLRVLSTGYTSCGPGRSSRTSTS
jgi:predicted nucleotidyltransferase